MPKFNDKTGREWTIEITLDLIPQLRDCGLDLAKVATEKDASQLDAVFLDPERLGQILWTLCEEQCQERGIDPRAFARCFDADALSAATDAMLLAVTDVVYKRPELRAMFRDELPKLWEKAEREARAEASKVTGTGYAG